MAFIDNLKVIRGGKHKVSLSFWMLTSRESIWKEYQIVGTIGVSKAKGRRRQIIISFPRPNAIAEEIYDDLMEYIAKTIDATVQAKPTEVLKIEERSS